MNLTPDEPRLNDLLTFGHWMVRMHDLEPWAEIIAALDLDDEDDLWLIKAYNAFDSLASAWTFVERWPSPAAWRGSGTADAVRDLTCTQERRGLRGGRVARHFDSYLDHLGTLTQEQWLSFGLVAEDAPEANWIGVEGQIGDIWGVGRQTSFEWAEFLAKAAAFPLAAPNARLWESTGPRRSLMRLYGNDAPTAAWLEAAAEHSRGWLAERGLDLTWEDYETLICDFNVMRDGRYYPGRHLAALAEEIEEIPEPGRSILREAWCSFVPAEYQQIRPGIDKALLAVYRDTGSIVTDLAA